VSKRKHLWDCDHPYYATHGCFYVSHTLGARSGIGGYDGNTCHVDFASWADFKAGVPVPLTAEARETRRQYGIDDAKLDEEARRWREATGDRPFSFVTADKDYNLLYRWDWKEAEPSDYSDGEAAPAPWLDLFYILQRKAKPLSVTVHNMRPEDEPEARAFLQGHWKHIQRLWAPFPKEHP
jgi:hypothetical protein